MAASSEKTDNSPRDSRDLVNSSLTDMSKASEEKEAPRDLEKTERSEPPRDIEAQLHQVPTQQEHHPSAEEDYYHMPTWRFLLVVIATCLTVLCMALDNSIVSTAIPKITDTFHALGDIGWYGAAYLLTLCAFPLFYGSLYGFYPLRWTFLSAIILFEIGSLICGVSPTSNALIVGRAIAGVGAAGIFVGALLIMMATVPLSQRPIYIGLVAAMYGIAGVAGPLLGGAFTDKLTWRWCFYINLPIGGVSMTFILLFLNIPAKHKPPTPSELLKKMDLPGTVMFVGALTCIMMAVQWGGSRYPWRDGRIIALFVLFGLLAVGFVIDQVILGDRATVQKRLITNRNVWGSCLFAFCLGASQFVLIYYIPIWFQAIDGVSAVKSAIMLLPLILALTIVAPLTGVLVTLVGYYTPFMVASAVFLCIGAGLLTTFTPETQHPAWIGYQVLFGIGIGLGIQQTPVIIQVVLPPDDVPIATAMILFVQTLGGAIFIAISQGIFTTQLIALLKQNVPQVDPYAILNVGATEITTLVNGTNLSTVRADYNKSLTTSWYPAVAMGALAIIGAAVVERRSVKETMPSLTTILSRDKGSGSLLTRIRNMGRS